ncbi:transmembrane protein [Thiorhodococcus drewsii AZ1]|uniref:Transmembrane protein n=1 Tax=Thiorhodococcus drewsii AZ1 TaxID=765913 RepID=G2E0Q3_9GAMM|nr:hypothetical protein [Thiorhodococcus drewsii]EGV31675.1 transmembrane protein [Thiorhodococcus drewsii AZ1]
MTNAENTSADVKSASGATRPKGRSLVLLTFILAIVFVGSGLVGHAPWKLHEVQSLEMVQTMADSGDFVVPMQAGQPALDTPPLYVDAATQIMERLADGVPKADAARVTSGLFLAVTLLFAGLLGRLTWKPAESKGVGPAGSMTVLLLIGTLGLFWFGHDAVADSALLAGATMGLYGLLLLPKRVLLGGLWFGTGLGIAFMAKGLLGPAILLITALAMPFLATWGGLGRQIRGIIVGLLFAAPWLLFWPWLLHERDPQLFDQWLWGNTLDLYLNNLALGTPEENIRWLWTGLLIAFPAWLLAPLALLVRPFAFFGLPGVRLALLASLVGWVVMLVAEPAQPIDALMLLVPLAVLGAGAVTRMPGILVLPIKWFSALLFAAVAIALWGLWGYLRFGAQLPEIAQLNAFIPADYSFVFQPGLYLVAAFATVIWLWIVMRFRSPNPSALLVWPAGVVMAWALLTLHQPLMDQIIAERGMIKEPVVGQIALLFQEPSEAEASPATSAASVPATEQPATQAVETP